MALTRASAAVVKTEELVNNRNRIINGDMRISQRGTSFTSDEYTLDRWYFNKSGATGTVTQETFTPGTELVDSPNYLKMVITTGNDNCGLQHKIEDVRSIPAGQVMLSFYAKGTNPGGGNFYVTPNQGFGSGGSTDINLSDISFQVTSSWQKFTIPITVPTISGKTIGTSSYFQIMIGQRTDTSTDAWELNITGVQLEVGSVATPFERRPFGTELALCQRYYWRASLVGNQFDVLASAQTATQISVYTKYPVEMRAVPTVVASQALSLNRDFTATYTQSSLDFTGSSSTKNLNGYASNFSGLTAGIHYQVRGNVSNISFSAEL
jgi:hypothetical protein